jgi:3-mercaptopyruvate sulfurtransferase SseA
MSTGKQNILPAVAVLAIATLACNALLPLPRPVGGPISTQSQDGLPLTEADVPRVTAKEARVALDSGAAIIVDVRDAESYAARHIPGALSIPLDEFETDPAGLDLDKEQWIITYCT